MGENRSSTKPPIVEVAIFVTLAVLAWYILASVEAFEMLVEFVEQYEEYDLDEVILALMCMSTSGFVYAWRRRAESLRELEKRRLAEERITWLARHDLLTELPNRRYLREFADKADASAHNRAIPTYAIYMLDLDGFKQINDLHGHVGGDELLNNVAKRLKGLAATEMVGRLGGDEFIVIVDIGCIPDVMSFGETILNAVTRPMRLDSMHAQVGCSIGVACFPGDGDTFILASDNADTAMYAVKKSGRNGVMRFDKKMQNTLFERAKLESDLTEAVHNHNIIPFYQPIVSLADGSLLGFEALARWTNKDGTQIPPSTFIPLADELGLITELSENMLYQACRDAKEWPKDLMLSFNLSVTQLSDKVLGLRIVRALGHAGFPASRLEIDVTESGLINEPETAKQILMDLQNAGVRLSLDDFGSGYSSLAHLAHYKFDRIKIDQAFIESFEDDKKRNQIIRAIVALGNGLEIATSAEGIEHRSQLEGLRDIGCHQGQGHLFGEAMPATDALVLTQTRCPERDVTIIKPINPYRDETRNQVDNPIKPEPYAEKPKQTG
ncbi:MAG: EAL domain-containing protein [Cohaesibacteraceae bacterium]|nr:EAL domain-containing protein [Cohaesibacteraceae bacterium]